MKTWKNPLVSATCAALSFGIASPSHAKVTAEICVSAQQTAIAVYEAALKNKSLYPTEADARAAAEAAFTRRIMAEDISDKWIRAGKEYTGDGRDREEYLYATELCRNLKAPYIAKAYGLLAELGLKGVRGPKTK